MKRTIVAGNWKMNLSIAESVELTKACVKIAQNSTSTEVWIAPSPEALYPCKQAIPTGSKLSIGSQNVAGAKSGAFTGETSANALKEIGCNFAIVGHSERRNVYGESDTVITERALGALEQGVQICFCIGEKIEERSSGATEKILSQQLSKLLSELKPELEQLLVIAYEPVWAIGTGEVATLEQIEQTHSFIQNHWKEKRGTQCPAILYGGSVKPNNFSEILAIPSVAGGLVGGASLKADSFATLVQIASVEQ